MAKKNIHAAFNANHTAGITSEVTPETNLLDTTINNLCLIKWEIKELEKILEEKKKQAEPFMDILLKNGGKKYSGEFGTLTKVVKENLLVMDNTKIAFEIGIDVYITNSKISVTTLKELRGLWFINKMINDKVMVQGEPVSYFLYKEPK